MKRNSIITNTFDFRQLPILIAFWGGILAFFLLIFGLKDEKRMGPYAMHTLIATPAIIWLFQSETIDRLLANKKKNRKLP